MKRVVVAFDFDGTITNSDSFLKFIIFYRGILYFILGLILNSHILLLYKLKLYSNYKTKQNLFSFFFKGINKKNFEELGTEFAKINKKILLRENAMIKLSSYLEKDNTKVYIISASIEEWVKPFFKGYNIEIISTKVQYDNENKLTGLFSSYNCSGKEKVRQLLLRESDRNNYVLVVYGDSKGDKELLEFADESYYKVF